MNIVIIDSSRIALKVLSATATRRGDNVWAFATGAEGLKHLRSRCDIDLVITNIDPDDMASCDVCRAVRAHRGARSTPLVVVTATRPSRSRITDILISGADDIVEMPFCEAGFLARLRIIERLVSAESKLEPASGDHQSQTQQNRSQVLHQLAGAISNISCEIPMSVAIFDIDRLADINKSFGRAAGDSAIRAVDSLIGSAGSESCHIGNGRFAFVLTGYEPQAALEACADMLMSIHHCQLDLSGPSPDVSVSAGLAPFYPGENPQTVLAHAEQALAEAKTNGGSRVHLHQTDDDLYALSH